MVCVSLEQISAAIVALSYCSGREQPAGDGRTMNKFGRFDVDWWLESPRPGTSRAMSWCTRVFPRCALAAALTVAVLTALATATGAEVRNSNGVAVIIGNMDYRDKDVFDVTYAHRDAEAFKHYVLDIRGFDPKNVIELRDATRQDMFKAFGRPGNPRSDIWAHLNPEQGSDVIVYYSGHGVPGKNDRKGYLLPVDVRPDVAENDAYPIELLYKKLDELDAANSVHVYLDACFSGGSHEGSVFRDSSFVRLSPKLPKGASKKLTILTAASDKQVASWDREARHGLFTHYLLNALYGKGDSNDDGRVTGDEVKKYLDDYMTRAAWRDYEREQTAVLIEGNQSATVLAVAPEEGFPARPSLTSVISDPPETETSSSSEETVPIRPFRLTSVNKTMVVIRTTPLRRRPDLMAELAGDVKEGQKVQVLAQTEDWYQIRIDSDLAYAQKDVLRSLQCRTVAQEQRQRVEIREFGFRVAEDRSTINGCKKAVRQEFDWKIKHDSKWRSLASRCRDDGGRLEMPKFDDLYIEISEPTSWRPYRCLVKITAPCVDYVSVKQEREICE